MDYNSRAGGGRRIACDGFSSYNQRALNFAQPKAARDSPYGSAGIKQEWALCPFFILCGQKMNLEELVQQTVEGMGYELVDFECSPRARLLRVFIDIARGITVDDCAEVSGQLQRVFEVENVDYDRLEVSSPGLDRALKKAADFVRFAGQQAQVKMRVAVDGQRNFSGEILNLENDVVRLRTEGGEVALPLADMDRARLVPVFD